MANQADEDLVNRSRRGDQVAFAEIVRTTARLVYAKIVLDVRDRHRAEDLTQEVFLIAWRSIPTLREAGALRGWLMAIAASVVANDIRKGLRKKRTVPPTWETGSTADPSPSPVANTQATEDRGRVLEALAGLPEEYRQPLALRYLAGADYETISKQLALSNGSLRGRLHRGLELLRKRM